MLYALVVMKAIVDVARTSGGVVRPIDVERLLNEDDNLSGLKITRYKIRQMFKECKEDGLLAFDGHQYIWRETHWLNGAGNDVIAVMNTGKR